MNIYLVVPANDKSGLSRALYKCEHPRVLVSFADAHFKRSTKLADLQPNIQKRPTKEQRNEQSES